MRKELIVFEYPEDYWSLTPEDRKQVQDWANEVFEEIKNPKEGGIVKMPPKCSLWTITVGP